MSLRHISYFSDSLDNYNAYNTTREIPGPSPCTVSKGSQPDKPPFAMATPRPTTPSASYHRVPSIDDPSHLSRGYGSSSHLDVGVNDFAGSQVNGRHGKFAEDFDAHTRGSSVVDGELQRSSSRASTLNQGTTPSRSGTLKKKGSVKRSGSLKRSGSRRSMHAGSIRGVTIEDQERGYDREDSVFYTPVPTKGSPTEVLADRFQSMCASLRLCFKC